MTRYGAHILALTFAALVAMPVGATEPPPPSSFFDLVECKGLDAEAKRFAEAEKLPLVELAIGDVVSAVVAQAPTQFPSYRPDDHLVFTGRPLRLSLDLGGVRLLAKTGGMSNVVTTINGNWDEYRVHSIEFYDQQCAITLATALARVSAIESKLTNAGFKRSGRVVGSLDLYELPTLKFRNWKEAEPRLAETPRRIHDASSNWKKGDLRVRVSLHNWGAEAPRTPLEMQITAKFGPQSVFEIDGTGRKYGVQFAIWNDALRDQGFKRSLKNQKSARPTH